MLSSIISRSKSAQPPPPPPTPPPHTPPDTQSDGDAMPFNDAMPTIIAPPPQANIAVLNRSLETLLAVFPAADVEQTRRLLVTSSEESRLYVVTEMLLKGGAGSAPAARARQLEPWQQFRSDEYKMAVKRQLSDEFRGLKKSTIHGVMAEHNFAYSRAHPTLSDLAAKSWRFSFSNFFRRAPRRTSSSLLDPVTGAHAPTGCKELDEELHEMGRAAREAQILADKAIAARLNEAEHAAADELVECECCFGDYPWEESVACADGHFFCHMCLIRSVQESVYGQGKSLLTAHCSVRCLSSTAQPPCTDSVPSDVLITVLPRELYNSLEDRTASENLEKSGLRLVRCPFCGYAEVDELQPFFIRRSATAFVLLLLLGSFETVMIPFALGGAFLLLSSLLFLPPLLLKPFTSPPWLLGPRLSNAIRAVGLRRRGSLFRCQNSRCARESCILCSKEWAPFHKCFEKEEDAARIYVERAMADAVKRTCPLCHVSFVKSDGCNKLTCPCGYVMCYICRADIRDVGYKHFCQHFRLVPGTACSDCEACDLYANEDEAAAIRTAAVAAEEEYWRRNGKPKGWSWRGVGGPVAEEVGDVRWGWGVALERGSEGLDQVLERFVEWAVEFT